ncbi:hypothetical protein [Dictyobacter halimunensis]|uniref:hypothetical protein n=1 Tax=Dictyobacter halimunensis TaxID=3026934 RepID=UPI0030C6B7D4
MSSTSHQTTLPRAILSTNPICCPRLYSDSPCLLAGRSGASTGEYPAPALAGSIVYEVPSAQHNFTLQFTPDITSNDMANWDFSV